ncbi:acyl-CoA dehydrogenase family protein [Actinoallomurus purpureus]|uniref:acyl-CoA dehydrogenase family protein n=1 Tax=Actinoallomurus purpureus TaxID=478114 RepID=UPI0020920432|nr:acyl-CoA dehydrogenase family protein [Actinoallomurus purpureus]MCO6008460.1 acyl-CoA dehydrogenase family protein [Actinoallomurus purpureus]
MSTTDPAPARAESADPLTVAAELAEHFAQGAADRDRDRTLPHAEIDTLSKAGMFALTVPSRYGGPDVDVPTLTAALHHPATGEVGDISPGMGMIFED